MSPKILGRLTWPGASGAQVISAHVPFRGTARVTFPVVTWGLFERKVAGLHGKVGDWPKACSKGLPVTRLHGLIVVFEPEMCDQVFAAQMAQSVLELHQLDEDVVF